MNNLSAGLFLQPDHWAQMEADIRSKAHEEACGLVLGVGNHSRLIIPVTNILHSPFRFRMEPKEQLDAFFLAEENDLEVLAVYHSHPQGIYQPSATDLDELTFPGIIYLIWYLKADRWLCRGYLMNSRTDISEVPVHISHG